MRGFMLVLIIIMAFLLIQLELHAMNPCSVWATDPYRCNSDNHRN